MKIILALLIAVSAGKAYAVDVKMSGTIYSNFSAVTSKHLSNGVEAHGRNEFDVSRIYLNAAADHDEHISSFVQLEANLLSRDPVSSGTTNQVFLKQAYLEYKELYPGAKLLFGLIQAPWTAPLEEPVWKHRFVAKTLPDEEGLLQTTDRGARLSGKAPHLGYELMVANGEGSGARQTTGNEGNKYKDFSGRLSFSPFSEGGLSGLRIHAFGQKGKKYSNWERDRAIGSVSFESGKFNAMASYYASRDGKGVAAGTDTVKGAGFSVFTVVNVAKTCWVFARWDKWDPDTAVLNNAHSRVIVGGGHALTDTVRMAVDYQALMQQKQTATAKDQGTASVHLEVKF